MRRIVIGSSASPRRLQRRRIVWTAAMPLASTGCAWLDERQRQLALRPTPGRPDDADDPAPHGAGRTRPPPARRRAPGVKWVEGAGGGHSRLHSEAQALYLSTFGALERSLAGA